MRTLLILLFCCLAASPAGAAEPRRILSVGGAITETVVALGAGNRLIGVDSTSLHPETVRTLPNVGYMRALSAEPVLALDPDLVLLHADAGPPPVVGQIRQSGVPVAVLPKATGIESTAALVRRIGEALERQAEGEALAADIARRTLAVSARARARTPAPAVLFLLSVGRGAPLAAGRGTAAAGMIETAGGRNAIEAFEGYKPLSPEAAIAADPEIVMVTERTAELLGGAEAILQRPEIRPTRAGKSGRLVTVDGLLILGFGPRLPQAVAHLAKHFHPGFEP